MKELGDPILDKLDTRLMRAFSDAYPDVPEDKVQHMARNFIQVIRGVIEIGRRLSDDGGITHMDIANGLVYSCVVNTRLEEFLDGGLTPEVSRGDRTRIISEVVARVADWLIGLEVLKDTPELFADFVKGAVMLGAEGWEKNRGRLEY